MDRKSYSHGDLHAIFRPFAIMLILYEKSDREAQSAVQIHTAMFPNGNGSIYSNYFDVEDIEFCLNTDKYVRKSILYLINEINIEFERTQSVNRTYKVKFKSDGDFRRNCLAGIFGNMNK